MKFNDIQPSTEFIADWESAPKPIQKLMDRKLLTWAVSGELPPSANQHRSHLVDESIFIIYVNVNWRLLVRCSDNTLSLVRLLNHEIMMKYFFH